MKLLQDIPALYVTTTDEVRGLINDGLYKKIYVDELGVQSTELREPFGEIVEASTVSHTTNNARAHRDLSVLARPGVVTVSDLLEVSRAMKPGSSSKPLLAEATASRTGRAAEPLAEPRRSRRCSVKPGVGRGVLALLCGEHMPRPWEMSRLDGVP